MPFRNQSVTIHINGVDGAVLSVESVRRLLDSSERGSSIIDGKANSVRIARGPNPGIGYMLMTKAGVDTVLKKTTFDNTITFYGQRTPGTTLAKSGSPTSSRPFVERVDITKMGVVGTTALTPAVAYDPITLSLKDDFEDQHKNTVVLVKFADPRWIARHTDTVTRVVPDSDPERSVSHYNLLRRYPEVYTEYYASSYYSPYAEITFTYAHIINDLWGALPSALFGTLDFTEASLPSTKPENYDFTGHKPWDALMTVLSDIDHTIAYRPEGDFYCVTLGGTTPVPWIAKDIEDPLKYDASELLYQSTSGPALFSPEKIKVYFHTDNWDTNNVIPGPSGGDLEDLIPIEAGEAWDNALSYYTKEIDHSIFLPSEDPEADPDGLVTPVPGTVLPLYAPLLAKYMDVYNTGGAGYHEGGLIQNQNECDAFALELAILRGQRLNVESRHNVYAGIKGAERPNPPVPITSEPFRLGADITSIAWFDLGEGFRTEILVSDDTASESPLGVFSEPESRVNEYPAPPNKSRVHTPPDALVLVSLSSNLLPGGSALANIQIGAYKGGTPGLPPLEWADSAEGTQIKVYEVSGHDYYTDDLVFVCYHKQTKSWVVVTPQASISFGRLALDLVSSDAVSGTLNRYINPTTVGSSLTVMNLTGVTLKAGVWCKAWYPHGWTGYALVEPYEMGDCPSGVE